MSEQTHDTHGRSQIITMLEELLEGIEIEVECPRKRRMMLSSVKFIIRELQPRVVRGRRGQLIR